MEYLFGKRNIEVNQCEVKKGILTDSYNCWIFGEFIHIGAKNQEELEQKIADYIVREQIKHQTTANELGELSLRIMENGLEKPSQNYQISQNKPRGQE